MSQAPASTPKEWRRTSPLSFVVRAVMGLRNLLFPAAAVLFGSRGWDGGAAFIVPGLVGMVLITWLFTWIAWRHFRYRLGESDIRVERGLVSRTARSVPYERIQDVSLEQKLVPRLFGMAEVKFETGAGGKDELTIGYVTAAEADALRETVRARRSGEVAVAVPGEVALPVEEPSRTLFAMDLRRLATFGLFEFSLVVFALIGGALQQFEALLPFDFWNFRGWIGLLAGPGHWLQELGFAAQVLGAALALSLLGIVGFVTGLGRTVLRDYGFRLEETAKGLRRRRGLLTRTDTVMPVHRVQALKVTTRIVRRRFGWYALEVVSLAQDAKSGRQVVVPFAQMSEIAPVIRVAGFDLPDGDTHWHRLSPRYRFDRALLGALPLALGAIALAAVRPLFPAEASIGSLIGVVALAGIAAFVAARERFLSRHDRHAIDGERIYVRRGWLAPRLDIASRVKLQSVEIAQGPLARRRGYADLKFGVAGGTLEIGGLPLEDARLIRDGVLHSIAKVDFSRLPG
ncbi:MAG TPA: PH domain-containing protein [Croceibacterium sp.]